MVGIGTTGGFSIVFASNPWLVARVLAYCSTHRVPSDTKRRSLPYLLPLLSVPAPVPVQADTRPLFIGKRGADGAAARATARAINMGRSRTLSLDIRRFISKARAGCRFVHFCEQTFAPHSVVSAFFVVFFASSCLRCRPNRVRRLPHLEPPVPRLDRTVRPPLRRRQLRVVTLLEGLAPLPPSLRSRLQVPRPRPAPLPPWSALMT